MRSWQVSWGYVVAITASMWVGKLALAADQVQKPSAATSVATTRAAEAVQAVVLQVEGLVQHRRQGQEVWQRTKVGDTLSAGWEIRTGLRSSAVLKLQRTVVFMVESASRAGIEQLLRSAKAETSRVALQYGAVRAGVVEAQITSNFQIVCPTAVLSREGTWGIRMRYDPATGKFWVWLDTDGLVKVVKTATGQTQTLTPGQYLTEAMLWWIRTTLFDRMVPLTDPFGSTDQDRRRYAYDPTGLGAVDATGDFSLRDLGQRIFNSNLVQQRMSQETGAGIALPGPSAPQPGVFDYPFGNFGTGSAPRDGLLNLKDFLSRSRSESATK